jgi:ubiquinone/menaquinone biosynthesis C-methylase UbiE
MTDQHVCPWWLAYAFDNPLRHLIHHPRTLLGSYVKRGMTVMDIGCGMGHFTLGLAELVGETGQVIAVDLQQQMLEVMLQRSAKKGFASRIIPRRADPMAINVSTPVDFTLAFWMVHEVPDPACFFKEVAAILKPAAKLLYAEPVFHVSAEKYGEFLALAEDTGLRIIGSPAIRFSRAALLVKAG